VVGHMKLSLLNATLPYSPLAFCHSESLYLSLGFKKTISR